jgi:hypothetical protein
MTNLTMTEQVYLQAVKTASTPGRVAEVCGPLISQVVIWALGRAMLDGRLNPQPLEVNPIRDRTLAACDRIASATLEEARIMGESVVYDYATEKRRIKAAFIGDSQRNANGQTN